MRFWSIIGKFLFFRWLFDSDQQYMKQDRLSDSDTRQPYLYDDIKETEIPPYRSNHREVDPYSFCDSTLDDDPDYDISGVDDFGFNDFYTDHDFYDTIDDDF